MNKLQQLTTIGLICLCLTQITFAQQADDPICFGVTGTTYTDEQLETSMICNVFAQWDNTGARSQAGLQKQYAMLAPNKKKVLNKKFGCDQESVVMPVYTAMLEVLRAFETMQATLRTNFPEEQIEQSPNVHDEAFNKEVLDRINHSWSLPFDQDITPGQNLVICGYLKGQSMQAEAIESRGYSIPAYTDLGLLYATATSLEQIYACTNHDSRFRKGQDAIFEKISDAMNR